MDARKRRYFLINKDGRDHAFAPLAELSIFIQYIQGDSTREVTFEEWLPVAWGESDYTEPPPAGLTETEYWTAYR